MEANKTISSTYEEIYEYFIEELTKGMEIQKEDDEAEETSCGILRTSRNTVDYYTGKAEALASVLKITQREMNKLVKKIKKEIESK